MKHTVYRSKMKKMLVKAHSGKAHFNKKFRFQVAKEIAQLFKHQLAAQQDWKVAQNG
jgi:hypothetical protein